jgi:hypothetical protein
MHPLPGHRDLMERRLKPDDPLASPLAAGGSGRAAPLAVRRPPDEDACLGSQGLG